MQIIINGQKINLVTDDQNKYGIEAIKEVAANTVDIVKNITIRLKDKKLSWLETLLTGMEIANAGKEVISELQNLIQEVKDLTQEEIKQIILFISSKTSLSQSDAGFFVENILLSTISIVFEAVKIYENAKQLF